MTVRNELIEKIYLSRALVELYDNASIAQTVAFRGGTALHKLFFTTPGRYSDLVQ
jgi:predicted nucleotidyltransferase component of viral defense system